jgi:TonB-linked SusC/RagA family outer membrane protein
MKITNYTRLLLTFLLSSTVLIAQNSVSGLVTTEDGIPLSGATILNIATNEAVVADFDGNYSISASTGDVVSYSYVGYESQEVKIGSNLSLNIQLLSSTELDEVVVLGFEKKIRSEITAAVSTINTQELTNLNTSTSISNMLQGKAAGVQVIATNGKPGSGAYVRIRGIGSITAGSAPLYIIDGVQAPGTQNINPFDIESVSVLKDAASSAIYGSRAANGVIIITTKRGKKNKRASVEFTSRFGYTSQTKEHGFRMMTSSEKLQYERELGLLGFVPAQAQLGYTSSLEDYNRLAAINFNWKDALLRDGEVVTNQISVSGGDENFQYYLSASEDKNEGIIEQVTGFQRQSARLNVDYKAKDWLKIGVNVSVADTRSDEPRDRYNLQSPIYAAYTTLPYETEYIRDNNGVFVLDENGQKEYNFVGFGWSITEALANNPEFAGLTTLLANVNLESTITDKLTNTTNFGINNQKSRTEYYYKPGSRLDSFVGDANAPGGKTDGGSFFTDYNISNVLKYKNSIGDHNFSISGLFEFNKVMARSYSLESIGFASGDLSVQSVAAEAVDASTNLSERTLLSYGGFLDYNFDGKYLFTSSIRHDRSSVFGRDNRGGTFWSSSAAWNIAREDFMQGLPFDDLKLRASAGVSGNQAGIGYYESLAVIGFGSFNSQSTAAPTDNGNPKLKFEENYTYDIGLEFTMFNDRLRGAIDYYKKVTSDLLLDRPLLSLGGEPDGSILSNVGEMVNKGVEIELDYDVLRSDDLYVNLSATFGTVDNEVTKLVPSSSYPEGAEIDWGSGVYIKPGEEYATFKLVRWAGVNPANGQPLWYDKDGNITATYSSDDEVYLSGKSPLADMDGGLNLFASYKGFDLSVDFYGKAGGYSLSYNTRDVLDPSNISDNMAVEAFNYWKRPGDVNVLPAAKYTDASEASDRYLYKTDYIRLRNLNFGYTIPSSIIQSSGLENVRVYLTGQNLWTYAPHYVGLDPEVGVGVDESSDGEFGTFSIFGIPILKSLQFGIDIKF